MNEYSTQPLTNALVGGLIGLLTLAAPIYVVMPANLTQVKSFVTINKQSYKTLLYDCNQQRVRTTEHVGQRASHVYQ